MFVDGGTRTVASLAKEETASFCRSFKSRTRTSRWWWRWWRWKWLAVIYAFSSSYITLWQSWASPSFSIADEPPPPACLAISRLQGPPLNISNRSRIVSIGDIHGNYDGLLEVMFAANITSSPKLCKWRMQHPFATTTLLIQTGDVVDRGPDSMKAFLCLRHLQEKAEEEAGIGSSVVRLLGNHDALWLEGDYSFRNPKFDTANVTSTISSLLKSDVMDGKVLGSFAHAVRAVPLLFVHAGLRPAMSQFILTENSVTGGAIFDARIRSNFNQMMSSYINKVLHQFVSDCSKVQCRFNHPLFQAGPDRGGSMKNIGGPFWTDFSVLEDSQSQLETSITPFVQIVGHTIHKYVIRASKFMTSIGIDSGMVIGGRAFLEITPEARFLAYEKLPATKKNQLIGSNKFGNRIPLDGDGQWHVRDLSREICDGGVVSA